VEGDLVKLNLLVFSPEIHAEPLLHVRVDAVMDKEKDSLIWPLINALLLAMLLGLFPES